MASIKCEELNAYKLSFCSGCLSTERVLSPLKDNEDIFQMICSNYIFQTPVLLCWECTAMLRRVRTFQMQVDDAQRTLHFYYMEKQDPPKCLSKLTINTLTQFTAITEVEVEIKKETEECKEDVSFNDDMCTEDYTEDVPDIKEEVNEDIKTETTKPPRKRPIKRKPIQNYKFIFGDENARNAVERVQVSHNELMELLEKTRRSDEYVNAKDKCERCVSSWNSGKLKKQHDEKYHGKSGSYTCDICSCKFVNKQSCRSHVTGHYLLFKCTHCGFITHDRNEYARHIYSHKKSVQCLVCSHIFSNLHLYRSHYRTVHTSFVCDECGRISKTKRALIKHIRNHGNVHKCNLCSIIFTTNEKLRRHEALRHTIKRDENSYCVLCDKQFDNKELYKRHIHRSAAHAKERKFQSKKRAKAACPICGKVYSRKSYMMNHYNYVHMDNIKQTKYYCGECDKQYMYRTSYARHMKYQHEGATVEKNKLCNICGRGFSTTRTLVNHVRTHSGEKPHECSHCNARFIQKHAMLLHIKHVHLKLKRRSGLSES